MCPGGVPVPGDNHTRGRRVEYLAAHCLREQGYCVIRSAGSGAPVDLVAAKHREALFVLTRRLRLPVQGAGAVAARFREDILRLQKVYHQVELPVQLWLYTDREGWRFYAVHPGGVAEVDGVCL